MENYYLTPALIEKLDVDIALLERLISDLRAIRSGMQPTPKTLAEAPLLSGWEIRRRAALCLTGIMTGHPIIGEHRQGVTSEVWFIDPRFRFIRTLSRFYRLGLPSSFTENSLQ